MSESTEHKTIKTLIAKSIASWTGASLTEFDSSGHELDVFATTPDGISIYVEVIWSASRSNFYRDMSMVQQSDAEIKLVVVNTKISSNNVFVREFSKIAMSQRRLGFEIHGELIDGEKLLNEPDYLNTTFKELLVNAIQRIRLHGKVAIERELVLPPPPVVDKTSEYLFSNLFPAVKYPQRIYGSPTTVRFDYEVFNALGEDVVGHPFLLKEKMLFSFDNPKTGSPFAQIITIDDIVEQTSESWLLDEVKRRDFIRLCNFALRSFCERRGLYYDKKHRRHMCLLYQGRDNVFRWRSRTRESSRKVARAVYATDGTLRHYSHYTAKLAFTLIDDMLFLQIEPSITLTSDGFHQLDKNKQVRFAGSRLRRQFNKQYLNYVRFWGRYLSQRSLRLSIPAGDSIIEVNTTPAGAHTEIGIAGDK